MLEKGFGGRLTTPSEQGGADVGIRVHEADVVEVECAGGDSNEEAQRLQHTFTIPDALLSLRRRKGNGTRKRVVDVSSGIRGVGHAARGAGLHPGFLQDLGDEEAEQE